MFKLNFQSGKNTLSALTAGKLYKLNWFIYILIKR